MIISVIISIGNMSIIPVVITYLIFFIESAPGIFYTHKYIFKERNVPERIGMALLSPLRSVVRGLAILSLLKQKLFGWYYDTGRKEGKDKGWKNL